MNGVPFPKLRCPHCGAPRDLGLKTLPGAVLSFEGNQAQCVNCRRMFPVPDGVFVAGENVFEKISSSMLSREEIQALIRISGSERARASAAAAKAAIEEEAPSLEPFLTDYWGVDPERWQQLLPLLLFAFSYFLTAAGLDTAGSVVRAGAGAAAVMSAAFKKKDVNVEDAVRKGTEAALEETDRRRRERNKRKRERRERR